MFIYFSNKLESLQHIMSTIIGDQSLRDPLSSEIILVQNNYIAQWIKIKLSMKFGIVANIIFIDVNDFFWSIYEKIVLNFFSINYFSYTTMVWKLMDIIPILSKRKNFEVIKNYLFNDTKQRKIFQLSTCMTNLFMKYLLYRPDWLKIWQNHGRVGNLNDKEMWQAELWYEFIKSIGYSSLDKINISNFYESVAFCLERCKQVLLLNIPKRIFVFSVSGLPPVFYKILQLLKNEISIHLFMIVPCRNYMNFNPNCNTSIVLTNSVSLNNLNNYNIFSLFYNNKKKNNIFISDHHNYYRYYFNQFLLDSWLKPIQNDLFFLSSLNNDTKITSHFINLSDSSLLNFLQKDILEYNQNITVDNCDKDFCLNKNAYKKRYLRYDDYSLSLHGCHSIQREVEVLYDNVLSSMSEDPSILPHEILVMSPNIEQYIPVINSVFSNSLKSFIPYVIVDKRLKDLHPILVTFLTFLKLPYSRYTSEDLLDLLEISAISTRFNFNQKQLKLLRDYVINAGICWGLDHSTFIDLDLPIINEYTWMRGLDRMLLGYAIDSDDGIWKDIFPYNNLSKDQYIELIGQLGNFLTKLNFWKCQLVCDRKLSEWRCCFRKMITDFFYLNVKEEKSFLLLETYLYDLSECKRIVKNDQLISISFIYDYLSNKLEYEWISQKFLSSGINFCKFSSKNFLPFKIIYLLGMNDNIFPHVSSEIDLNLMMSNKRCGDYDLYDYDCYSFLEILLSATKKIYMSFIYCSINDGSKHYPSILIDKLVEYIAQNFLLQSKKNINAIDVTVDDMFNHLCTWHSSSSSIISNSYTIIEKYYNICNVDFPIIYKQNFFDQNDINLFNKHSRDLLLINDLLDFYKSPVKYWFNKILLISFNSNIISPVNHEPFGIQALIKYLLNTRLLNYFIEYRTHHHKMINDLYLKMRISGFLPYGGFGKLHWLQQCNIMSKLAANINKYYDSNRFNMDVSLLINNTKIIGMLPYVQNNGLLRWCSRVLSIKDGLLLWIEHLIYCAMGGTNDSKLFGINSKWHFPSISVSVAKNYLFSLLNGYYDGMVIPLLLLNKSASSWLNCCLNRDTKTISVDLLKQYDAKKKLLLSWKGNAYIFGESKDPYLQRLIGNNPSLQDIESIIAAAKRYYLPIIQYNIK